VLIVTIVVVLLFHSSLVSFTATWWWETAVLMLLRRSEYTISIRSMCMLACGCAAKFCLCHGQHLSGTIACYPDSGAVTRHTDGWQAQRASPSTPWAWVSEAAIHTA
jgi:hypothetical protein